MNTLKKMGWIERIHFLHRALRYRYRAERFGIRFMLDRIAPGDTVLDIGGNRGLFSFWMARAVGGGGRVIAFEPQPELQDAIDRMRSTFKFDQVEVVAAGLSASPGTLVLSRPLHHWGGASFEKRESQISGMEQFDVEVTTLDDFAERNELNRVSFIKCDVEGHELSVFQGGEQFLRNCRPALLFECDDADDPDCAVFRFLEGLGYRGYCFHNGLAPIKDYSRLKSVLDPKAVKDFVFLAE